MVNSSGLGADQGSCKASSISKNIALHSVGFVRLTHMTREGQSRIRTQPPYHTTYLMQSDAAPYPQDAPATAPDPLDAPDATTNSQDAI